ncbi:hypothetical protein [Micromonospora sediminicola]|uniref:hypothetical protein n=1 Tax=Micromonospora sediminicola TaxID=946078 RepID=UPI0037B49347
MTSPADDCGVTGGCQACPLFVANVCGDPAPAEPHPMDRGARSECAELDDLCGTCGEQPGSLRHTDPDPSAPPVDWGPAVDAYLAERVAAYGRSWEAAFRLALVPARFEVGAAGVALDRSAPVAWDFVGYTDESAAVFVAPVDTPAPIWAGLVAELPGMWEPADFLGGAPDEVRPPTVDPDAPDVDPNEPKPEGAGCCGGKCGSPC